MQRLLDIYMANGICNWQYLLCEMGCLVGWANFLARTNVIVKNCCCSPGKNHIACAMNYNVEHFNLYCGMWRLLRFSCFYSCCIFLSFFFFVCSLNPFAHLHTTSSCVVTREECAWRGVGRVYGFYVCDCVCDVCEKNDMGTRELNDILLAHCHIEFHAYCLWTGWKKGTPSNKQHSLFLSLCPSHSFSLSPKQNMFARA